MYWQIRHNFIWPFLEHCFAAKNYTTVLCNVVLQQKSILSKAILNMYIIYLNILPQIVWALPSTLEIKLQDRFRVRREDREANPSIQQMWLDDRSRCLMYQAVVKPSILVRRLQWRFKDEMLGFRWTSSRLQINIFSEVTITHYCT